MPFVEPITIKHAVEMVHSKKYLLPAIQREFVWSTYQTERLFDSLLRGYPISSFLFWSVERENTKDFKFYEFIRDYHERDATHNPKADVSGENEITAILDGQQRLTSLYIGLKGSYAYKMPRKRWDNDQAFPKRYLYLGLTNSPENNDLEYNFKFLTENEATSRENGSFWFRVGDILDLPDPSDINDFLVDNSLMNGDRDSSKRANKTLFALWRTVHESKPINFFLEKDESLDKVLNIFIRVNSGGTELSYSDLLLSIATAQWKKRDARQVITEFVDEINGTGNGFSFNKDFVLKSCLVLCDFKNIAFKVDNFNSSNMLKIEDEWEQISDALRTAVMLADAIGYQRETLTSNNAIIPIAYYLLQRKLPSGYIQSQTYSDDRERITQWIRIALLKRIFGGQADSILRPIRDVIKNQHNIFPSAEIINKLKGTNKSMVVDDDEIENLLDYQYGKSYTFSVLSFLYPGHDFRNKFHQDHIFPKSQFTYTRLRKAGISEESICKYREEYNGISNLQLLEGIPNQEKSSKHFAQWIADTYPDEESRNAYCKRHYIPDCPLGIDNFIEFCQKRRELLKAKFKTLIENTSAE